MKKILVFLIVGALLGNCKPETTGTTQDTPISPPDTTAPVITSETPANNSTLIPINTVISITFSESMDSSTINTSSFSLSDADMGNQSVSGTVVYDEATKTATFTPGTNLGSGHAHVVNVSTSVKDLAGNSISSPYGFSFITDTSGDNTAPVVISRNPASGAVNIPFGTTIIEAIFSEAVQPATAIISVSGSISGGISGSSNYNPSTSKIGFNPVNPLGFNEIYTVTINAMDYANNPMIQDVYSFQMEIDITAPLVSAENPPDLSTGNGPNSVVTITFNEEMISTDFSTGTFTLVGGGFPVSGTVSYANKTATFTPTYGMEVSTTYTATVSGTVRDRALNQLGPDKIWTFTTGATGDTIGPGIISTIPAHLTTSVSPMTTINVYFSESINPATLTSVNFKLYTGYFTLCPTSVTGTITYDSIKGTSKNGFL